MEPQMNTDPCLSVILSRKSFAGRKGFFFAKSSRSSRLRGEPWAGLSPRRREARKENAKDFSLVAARLLCVYLWFHSYSTFGMAPLLGEIRGRLFQFVRSACARGSRGWGRRVHPAG